MQKEIGDMQKTIVKQCGKCFIKKPDDYVISTGKQYSIKQFINLAAKKANMKIVWKGKDI